MDVLAIPFNALIGVKYSSDRDFILELEKDRKYLNHINTVSAGAQFSLAEATSGEFLLRTFSEYECNIVPVVRKAGLKYKKPAQGKIRSKASMVLFSLKFVRKFKLKSSMDFRVFLKSFNSFIKWFVCFSNSFHIAI